MVNVRTAEGRAFQASVTAPPALRPLEPGTPVHLEVNPKTGEVRFDPGHPVDHPASGQITSLREAVQLAREMRDEMRGAGSGPAGLSAAMAHLGEAAAAAAAASQLGNARVPGAPVIGGAEAAELVHDLLGGGDRAAALARIKQLREQALIQGGGQAGPDGAQIIATSQAAHAGGVPPVGQSPGPAQPESFHSNEPGAFTPFGAGPPTGPQHVPGSFGGAAPTGFSPITPPPVTRSGAFGEAVGGRFGGLGDSKSDRIARLEDQRDRGQISQEQFEAQRQQIRDEF
jgi:hypothetical protein